MRNCLVPLILCPHPKGEGINGTAVTKMSALGGIRIALLGLKLATKDCRHEFLLSFCAISSLAAVLLPLLVLFGVKFGVVNTMTERLLDNPRNREVIPIGVYAFSPEWFASFRVRPDIAFLVPQTRSIAATMDLSVQANGNSQWVTADLVPSGVGDPLLAKWHYPPPDVQEIVVAFRLAEKLHIQPGAVVTGTVQRSVSGQQQEVSLPLKVTAVLPESAYTPIALFVHTDILLATEAYRNGYAVPNFSWPGQEPAPSGARSFPNFRMYTRSIDDVAPLAAQLRSTGIDVNTRAEEIETVKALDSGFSLVYWIIFFVTAVGYFFSTFSSALATVVRKRRELGVLSLIGFPPAGLVWYTMGQSLVTGVLGLLVAFFVYAGVQGLINRLFKPFILQGENVCLLLPQHFIVAFFVTLVLLSLSSSFAAWRVLRQPPSEMIRDV